MTKQTTKLFLESFGLDNDDDIIKYKKGWTISEIKQGSEFILKAYKYEIKCFKDLHNKK